MGILGERLVSDILGEKAKKTKVKYIKGVFSSQRDYAIICRFYYHYKLNNLRYDVVISKLREEFYLGETTITQIVMREKDLLEKLKAKAADKKFFIGVLPHYNWI